MYPKIILKKGKERPLQRFHLWVFSGAIQRIEGEVTDGAIVQVYSFEGKYLAVGHYNTGSIRVRILSFKQDDPAEVSFWESRLQEAIDLRKSLELFDRDDLNVFRLVHGEGDRIPGLILDYYNGVVVLQAHSKGIFLCRAIITTALLNLLGSAVHAVYDKSHGTLNLKEHSSEKGEFLYGDSAPVWVKEYDNEFLIDFKEGQKTGFFIDQRENRKLLRDYSLNKKVLNVFSYTGGFSVYAAAGKASQVHSVDISQKAIDLVDTNMERNFGSNANLSSQTGDAFEYLKEIPEKYDVIVLDPPAFAKHKDAHKQAMRAYSRINEQAIRQISKGGILFTFSCSQVISKEDFRKAVFEASAKTGKNIKILHQLTQPADHPVNIFHPEGEYLKGLVLSVS